MGTAGSLQNCFWRWHGYEYHSSIPFGDLRVASLFSLRLSVLASGDKTATDKDLVAKPLCNMCIYIYIHMYIISLTLSLSLYIYIYICLHMHIYTYMYIYIYIYVWLHSGGLGEGALLRLRGRPAVRAAGP